MAEQKLGTEHLEAVVDGIGDFVKTIFAAAKDGIDMKDLMYIPAVIGIAGSVAKHTEKALAEAKDLDFDEVSILAGKLAKEVTELFVVG